VFSLRRIDEINSLFDIDFQLDLDWDDPVVTEDLGLNSYRPDEWATKISPESF
jgi:hypothetical protein